MLNLSKLLSYGKKNLLFKGLRQVQVNSKFSTNAPIQINTSLVGSHSRDQWDKFKKENIKKTYKLSNEMDIKGIVEKYKRFRTKLKLNEEIVFLHSIAETVITNNIKFNIIQHPAIDSLLEKIKAKLRNSEDDYPLIGSLIYSLNTLQLYKDQEIWLISSDYVIDGRLDGSFEELIELFKGCTNIQRVIEGPQTDGLFSVLEDRFITEYRSSEIVLNDLVEITKCYSSTQRSNYEFIEVLYQNFSNHILSYFKDSNPLNCHYLIQLAYHFAGWEFIVSDSYNYFQTIIESRIQKEELQDTAYPQLDPESLALITYSLGIAIKNDKIVLSQNILKYLKDYLESSDTSFQLKHLEYFYRFLLDFGPETEKSFIYKILKNKIHKVDHSVTSLNNMKDYITTRVAQEFHDNFFEFPLDVFKCLDEVCAEKLWTYTPQEIYEFFDFIEETEIRTNFKELWFHLPEYIVAKIGSFNFEQMCYLYYVYVKHGALKETGKFKENLEILKDYILLHYAATARGKLSINSNFYKVLEVVDINKFYQKGEY